MTTPMAHSDFLQDLAYSQAYLTDPTGLVHRVLSTFQPINPLILNLEVSCEVKPKAKVLSNLMTNSQSCLGRSDLFLIIMVSEKNLYKFNA